jgi:uncharacterized protein (UPF0262 family)
VYQRAIRQSSPQQIETIDMARRGIHYVNVQARLSAARRMRGGLPNSHCIPFSC